MKKLHILMITVLIFSGGAHAIEETSSINGTVLLEDGSPIPGVTVTLAGDLFRKKATVSSSLGHFRFLRNPPGMFELKLEWVGFITVIRKTFRLFPGRNMTFILRMKKEELKEFVEVTGQGGAGDARSTILPSTLSKEMIQPLPTERDLRAMREQPNLLFSILLSTGTDLF